MARTDIAFRALLAHLSLSSPLAPLGIPRGGPKLWAARELLIQFCVAVLFLPRLASPILNSLLGATEPTLPPVNFYLLLFRPRAAFVVAGEGSGERHRRYRGSRCVTCKRFRIDIRLALVGRFECITMN